MSHPDFRVNGRIFATLHGDGERGMVKLSPEEQARFIGASPEAFAPESGSWGLQGCTSVRLKAVDEELLGEAMTIAWRIAISKPPAKPRAKAPRRKR